MKALEIKSKNHYVWSNYLKRWTIDGKNIWHISPKNKVCTYSISGVACEELFYEVMDIHDTDLSIVKMITNDCHPTIKLLNEELFSKVYLIKKMSEIASGIVDEKLNIDIKKITSANTFENYLSAIERDGDVFIKKFISGDVTIKSDDEYYRLCHFIAFQYARTKRMKSLLSGVLRKQKLDCERQLLESFHKRNWWFMCSFFANNLSFDMAMSKSDKLTVIDNKTEIEFITSDQPVVNIHPKGHLSESIDYYYPISPRKAILIKTSNEIYFTGELTKKDVISLNEIIALQSYKTIFSSKEELILENKVFFNRRVVRKEGF